MKESVRRLCQIHGAGAHDPFSGRASGNVKATLASGYR
jgi:hypothetical protein